MARVNAGMGYYKKILRHDPCVFCGAIMSAKRFRTIDHIHPKSMGGVNTWMNLAATCNHCNSMKSSSSVLDHLMGHKRPIFNQPSMDFSAENTLPVRWYDPLEIYSWA